MYLLNILIIYLVTFLQVLNASDSDNYSKELEHSIESHKRTHSRIVIQKVIKFNSLLRSELRKYNEQIDIPFANKFINDIILDITNMFSDMIKQFHKDENQEDYYDTVDWQEADKILSNNKWEPFRQFLQRVSVINALIEKSRLNFEEYITQFRKNRKKRHIIERLENLLVMQKVLFRAKWLLSKIFEKFGFDEKTHNWKHKDKGPFINSNGETEDSQNNPNNNNDDEKKDERNDKGKDEKKDENNVDKNQGGINKNSSHIINLKDLINDKINDKNNDKNNDENNAAGSDITLNIILTLE